MDIMTWSKKACRSISSSAYRLPMLIALLGMSLAIYFYRIFSPMDSLISWRFLADDAAQKRHLGVIILVGIAYSAILGFHLFQQAKRANTFEQLQKALEKSVQEKTEALTKSFEMLQMEMRARREVEAQLENHARALAGSNQMLEEFAFACSHDLQEPLRAIAVQLQFLEKRYKGKLDENADKFIDFAVEGAKRMQKMVQDLLALSVLKAKAGEFQSIDCNKVMDQVCESMKFTIEEKKVQISTDPLPLIFGNATQITQLFHNLMSNAIKYGKAEAPRIRVSAALEKLPNCTGGNTPAREWLFSIQDNGIGIDPSNKTKIFGLFQRLHTNEEYPGTGVGLAICKRVVENHGGRIWVESKLSGGSIFYFTLTAFVQEEGHAKNAAG